MSSSHSDSEGDESEEDFREDMRVFLRLRPMNKLETSRRSKNCVELSEDPTVITVDSPLEGEYDFTFDHVFEEDATQDEVYEHALQGIPAKLVEGYNCTVIAYGQTGTGKTHTMLGVNGGLDSLAVKIRGSLMPDSSSRSSIHAPSAADTNPSEEISHWDDDNPEAQGMISKAIVEVFEEMKQSPESTEFIIRCSYVEIYLEKILDLLHQHNSSTVSLAIENEADKAAGTSRSIRIVGASELCCLNVSDVFNLLARGNACRTMSATEMNTDSSRSHAVFVMRMEQHDRTTGATTISTLHMIDLAGSELAANPASRASLTSPGVQAETKMINKSLNALQKMIRAQLEYQQGAAVNMNAASRQCKLTKLLRSSFGGNCLTALILTASPSSYNIGETISTIRFGQRCRKIVNTPIRNTFESVKTYCDKLKESEQKYLGSMALIRTLANKCLTLGVAAGESATGSIWETIQTITSEDEGQSVDFTVSVRRQEDNGTSTSNKTGNSVDSTETGTSEMFKRRIEILEEELAAVTKAREDTENALGELQSEVAVLRTQNENLHSDRNRNITDLMEAKNEVQMLSQRKLEVEHNLRTSQFRENEAIVFLRQFRRFYMNVLKDKAAHGAGSIKGITKEITHKVPNAPDLNQLRDIDEMLLEAGLLEESEMGEERSSTAYKPSKDSLMRSAAAASRAARVDSELDSSGTDPAPVEEASMVTGAYVGSIRNFTGSFSHTDEISEVVGNTSASAVDLDKNIDILNNGIDELNAMEAGADAGAGTSEVMDPRNYAHSICRGPGTGLVITRQQKMLRTPSGRLTIIREKEIENELVEMSERCIALQTALNEEKAIVDALTNKAGGMSKKKVAQEAISLRQQLEKKTASLTAIAWKMNELNLINKTYTERMVSREQHVLYLEESLLDLQNNISQLTLERQEDEKKLREEVEHLTKVVEGVTMPLWQFSEVPLGSCSLPSRLLVPVVLHEDDSVDDQVIVKRKLSTGDLEPDVDEVFVGVVGEPPTVASVKMVENRNSETQTDPIMMEILDAPTISVKMVENRNAETQTDPVMIETASSVKQKSGGESVGPVLRVNNNADTEFSSFSQAKTGEMDVASVSRNSNSGGVHLEAEQNLVPLVNNFGGTAAEAQHEFDEEESEDKNDSDIGSKSSDPIQTSGLAPSPAADSIHSRIESSVAQTNGSSMQLADGRGSSPAQGDNNVYNSEDSIQSISDIKEEDPKKSNKLALRGKVGEQRRLESQSDVETDYGSESDAGTEPSPEHVRQRVDKSHAEEESITSSRSTDDSAGASSAVDLASSYDNNEIVVEKATAVSLEPSKKAKTEREKLGDVRSQKQAEFLTPQSAIGTKGGSGDSDLDDESAAETKKFTTTGYLPKTGPFQSRKMSLSPRPTLQVDSFDNDADDGRNGDSGRDIGKKWVDEIPPPTTDFGRDVSCVSLNDGMGLSNDYDYDDLGKKWGMSESEIAEDAAILTPRQRDSDDLAGRASLLLAASLDNKEPENSDEESINKWVRGKAGGSSPGLPYRDEGTLVKPVAKGWRTQQDEAFKPKKRFAKGNDIDDEDSIERFTNKDDGDDEASYDDNSDDNDTYEDSLKKIDKDADSSFSVGGVSRNSLNEDDFEKMMGEATSALAAAQKLIPTDDEVTDNETMWHDRDDLYRKVDSSKYGDAEASRGNYYDSLPKDFRRLTDEQLKGGKTSGFQPSRFVDKLGPRVKPAVIKEGKKSLLPEYDDYSVSVAADTPSVALSISHSMREGRVPLSERKETKKLSKREKESKSIARDKIEESKRSSSRKGSRDRSSSRKPKTKDKESRSRSRKPKAEEKERSHSKSKSSRHLHSEENGKKTRHDNEEDSEKKKKVKRSHSEKKIKHHDGDDKKSSNKKKSDSFADRDDENGEEKKTKKKKSTNHDNDDIDDRKKSRKQKSGIHDHDNESNDDDYAEEKARKSNRKKKVNDSNEDDTKKEKKSVKKSGDDLDPPRKSRPRTKG